MKLSSTQLAMPFHAIGSAHRTSRANQLAKQPVDNT